MTEGKTVLVIEANARAAVEVVRSLLRRSVRVIVASAYRWCASFYVRGVRKRLRHPSVVKQPEEFIAWLLKTLSRYHVAMLLPLGDVATALVARHRETILRYCRLFLPKYECFLTAHDKILTNKAALAAGIEIPPCWYPDEKGLDEVMKSARYPVVVKPAIGVGAREFAYAQSSSDLQHVWNQLQQRGKRFFVQEYISSGRQFVVDLLLDRCLRTVAAVVSEKVHYFPIKAGASTLSRSVLRTDLCEIAEKFLRFIGFYGVANVDMIEDPRDGRIKLLEVNPRFGEMHAICNLVGVDLPWLLYCLVMRLPMPSLSSGTKEMYLRCLPTELMWFIRSPDRLCSSPAFWENYDGSIQDVFLSRHDFGPLMGYLLENLSLLANPVIFMERFGR